MVRCRTICLSLCLITALVASAHGEDAIRWAPNLQTAVKSASQNNQLVLLHFWAPGCGPCRALESNVFNRPEVAQAIARDFVPVKINAEAMPELAGKYKVDRWPMDVVITPAGYPVHSMVSPQDPREYMQILFRVAEKRQPGNRISSNPQDAISSNQPGDTYRADPQNDWAQQPAPQPTGNAWGGSQGQASQFAAADQGTPSQYENRFATPQNSQFGPSYANQYDQGQQDPHMQVERPVENSRPANPRATANPYVNDRPPVERPPVERAAAQPTPPQQANKIPPMGMDGYSPVTLVEHGKWVEGDKAHGVIHRGRLYLFTSDAEKQTFWADPDRYAPILSGNDPVEFADTGRIVQGSRKHGVFFRNQIYLFVSEASLERFWNAPQRYSDVSLQAMRQASERTRR